MSRREASEILAALGILLLGRLVLVAISPHAGSYDLGSWAEVVKGMLLTGNNPYADTTKLNWPPFWLQVIYLLGRLSLAAGIHFGVMVKLFLVCVEGVLTVVLYLVARHPLGVHRPLATVTVAICFNPVALFQVILHCNFDIFVGLWILLFFWSLARFAESGEETLWLLSAMFLGLAIWTKTVPLCLVPLTLCGIGRVSRPGLLIGYFLVFAPVTIAMSVIYVLTPGPVVENVLHYRSAPGFFGISGILYPEVPDWSRAPISAFPPRNRGYFSLNSQFYLLMCWHVNMPVKWSVSVALRGMMWYVS